MRRTSIPCNKENPRPRLLGSPPPPHPEWVVVNSDGSVKYPDSLAAAGGLVRDSSGRCLGAFASNLGACTITRAELLGAIQGLRLAWSLG
ncbi:unnamed protein product [Linum tenue]|uniref:RNase H type-1 domain-containing protein n=1 Tax=Linum tenue TaxID=586396 RepID=A0AAV0KHU5_9ROSI|nr:unnamed protein product [Linum tenue]